MDRDKRLLPFTLILMFHTLRKYLTLSFQMFSHIFALFTRFTRNNYVTKCTKQLTHLIQDTFCSVIQKLLKWNMSLFLLKDNTLWSAGLFGFKNTIVTGPNVSSKLSTHILQVSVSLFWNIVMEEKSQCFIRWNFLWSYIIFI